MASPEPRILSEGKTPEQWVAEFRDRGLCISERTLRSRARELGAFGGLGKAMVLLPEHIDRIFKGGPECRSNDTEGVGHGGPEADWKLPENTSDAALAQLTKQSQSPKSRKRKGGRANVLSLETERRNRRTN